MALGTSAAAVHEVQSKTSDPTLRGFDSEAAREEKRRQYTTNSFEQNAQYKFCKFKTIQRFTSPHYFEAEKLLKSLAQEVSFLLVKHKWVVGSLNEMDPENDALFKKKEKDCSLLGYNENAGKCIYLLLRTPDGAFRERDSLIQTLLHELCHNEVGPHNAAFFALYARLRSQYLTSKQNKTEKSRFVTLEDDTRSTEQVVADELRSESDNAAISQSERTSAAAVAQFIEYLPEEQAAFPIHTTMDLLNDEERQQERKRRAEAAERRLQRQQKKQ
mmetsp:Transcript_15746/g.19241  ORF Transcript_15746/g.19241 Transcript_15746/m.19241 type:complete len:274 (-) Transcript_15746:1523-2344(-)